MSQLTTGIIEGQFRYDNGGTLELLPFQDAIENATLSYNTTQLLVETFSANGIKGASAACPFSESLTISMGSSNLLWSFLQAALGTRGNDATEPELKSVSPVLSVTTGSPEVSTYDLGEAPLADPARPLLAADAEGNQLPVTVSGTTVTFESDLTGQKITISYFVAASGTNNEIQLGAGDKILETGIYCRFFGCPDTYVVAVPRAVISSNVAFTIGDSPASATFEANALRDPKGNFAYILKVAS